MTKMSYFEFALVVSRGEVPNDKFSRNIPRKLSFIPIGAGALTVGDFLTLFFCLRSNAVTSSADWPKMMILRKINGGSPLR